MKKQLLLVFASLFVLSQTQAQTADVWSAHQAGSGKITTDKGVARLSFPKEFKLYDLNINSLRQTLFAVNGNKIAKRTIISLPNADGQMEDFEVYEASNFEADLQVQFPEIRAYSGKGITDKYATLKLSIAPNGIQTMVFRTDKENEFIEPYSQDHAVYAVFKSQRQKGGLAWSCSTDDKKLVLDLAGKAGNVTKSSTGQLKTIRLAQSCTGEYGAFFGASTANNAADKVIVMTAFNNTITRCNGVYEKDLALHLNLITNTTAVIYTNSATDPYATVTNALSPPASWNGSLQTTLTNLIGEANYDIGHLFGASGGGGNAGCIGCVCVDGQKGSGITSPATGTVNPSASFPPSGDTFDIDYVVHEIGHQLGATHTFSNSNEGSGTNVEIGSGITIMGYAGITNEDIAPHSIDAYHAVSISQIQENLVAKTCPITTSLAGTNATPVVSPVSNYTIPISTPFVLTGAASDANAGDALTYSWEQNDDGGASTGAASSASTTKTIGPNFISFSATASPSRYFPRLASIIANSPTTGLIGVPGDAGMLSEALSSVARTLNFRLTVRDNSPYSSIAPIKVGQTAFTDMKVTVDASAGPFVLTAPNTAVTLNEGANQIVTWNKANTDIGTISEKYVDIYFSTDGGNTYPTLLASKVPNDGSETITVPVSAASGRIGAQNRIMVKANNNIFFDISNINMSTVVGGNTFAVGFNGIAGEQNKGVCQGSNTVNYTFNYSAMGTFSAGTNFTAAGVPVNTTVSFSPTSRTTDGIVTMTVTTTATTPVGLANIIVTGTSGATTKTVPFYLDVAGAPAAAVLSTPANNANAQGVTVNLTWAAGANSTAYDIQVATDSGFTNIIATGTASTTNYTVSGLSQSTDYYWRIMPRNASCSGIFGSSFKFTTGVINCITTAASGTQVPKTIRSTNPTPVVVTSTVAIPVGGTIADVNITMGITHTWVGDLVGTLTSPTGTVVQLFSRPCDSGSTNANIGATFDDSGSPQTCPGITGTVVSTQSLSGFNGTNSTGTWTLTINDMARNDGGTLDSWSLNICTVSASLSNPEFELNDISLYPNPNNGDFTVRFTSASTNDIKINIHDMRGRQVYEKSFSNTGAFNQNINLDKVEAGIYLVTITDGAKKTVKRIIVE